MGEIGDIWPGRAMTDVSVIDVTGGQPQMSGTRSSYCNRSCGPRPCATPRHTPPPRHPSFTRAAARVDPRRRKQGPTAYSINDCPDSLRSRRGERPSPPIGQSDPRRIGTSGGAANLRRRVNWFRSTELGRRSRAQWTAWARSERSQPAFPAAAWWTIRGRF